MADAVLTKKQGLILLQELISNAGFRRRFAEKPAAALLEIGVPAETVVNLSPKCLAPRKESDLALPADLQTAHDQLQKSDDQVMLSMLIPNARV